jgi:hypothetical protein
MITSSGCAVRSLEDSGVHSFELGQSLMSIPETFRHFGILDTAGRRDRALVEDLARDYGVLEDSRCRCGAVKPIGKPFCNDCWEVLPSTFQTALRNSVPARGFTHAYRAALIFLCR